MVEMGYACWQGGQGEQMQGAWRFYVPELHYQVWYGAVEMGQRSNLGGIALGTGQTHGSAPTIFLHHTT